MSSGACLMCSLREGGVRDHRVLHVFKAKCQMVLKLVKKRVQVLFVCAKCRVHAVIGNDHRPEHTMRLGGVFDPRALAFRFCKIEKMIKSGDVH
ncbi:MAG: hypothetical protein R3A47_06045 [Polyangiales bacterium]